MPFVEWDDKYLLGIEQFDVHHKHLIELLNKIYEMLLSGECEDGELQSVIDSLAEYATYHLTFEENWMSQLIYHKQEEHSLEHKEFVIKLMELNNQIREGKTYLTLETVSFLRAWLMDHILNTDAEYGAFIRRRPL